MSFTGVAVVKYVSDRLVRITGLSLASDSAGIVAGIIGLHESTQAPDVRLPAGFQPRPYDHQPETKVTLQDAVAVRQLPVNLGTMPYVTKSGTTPEDFEIVFAAQFAGELGGTTAEVEIYITFH